MTKAERQHANASTPTSVRPCRRCLSRRSSVFGAKEYPQHCTPTPLATLWPTSSPPGHFCLVFIKQTLLSETNMEPEVSHFTVFRQPPNDEKRRKEAQDLYVFLRHVHQFMKFDNVRFGQPPHEPDFVFDYRHKNIGADLTVLNPKVFHTRGYVQRGKFKDYRAKSEPHANRHEFNWGKYSLRDSLAAFKAQLDCKRQKANHWGNGLSRTLAFDAHCQW